MTIKLLKYLISPLFFSLLMGLVLTFSSLLHLIETLNFSFIRIMYSILIGLGLGLLVFGVEMLFYRSLQGKLVAESKYAISELWKGVPFALIVITLMSQDSPYGGFVLLSCGIYLLTISLIFYLIRNRKSITFQ